MSTNKDSKEAFLESTKAAREARKANRDRERAAIVLQSAIRGWLTRIRIEKDVRKTVDRAIEGGSDRPTAVEMYRMARNFLTFCKPRKDTERLEKICRALVSSLVSIAKVHSYAQA
jgi:hypothetical protein